MTKKDKPQKLRITVDLSESASDRLDQLLQRAQITTKSDLIREALRLYEYVVEKAIEGYKFQTVSENGEVETISFLSAQQTKELRAA